MTGRASFATSLVLMALLAAGAGAEPAGLRRITQAALLDKIRGGWAGQMIGVSYGAPTEFKSNGRIIEGEIAWSPERVENAIHQDDLYVEMTFAEVMDRLGLGRPPSSTARCSRARSTACGTPTRERDAT